ncbi:MAG: radical SAM protein [Alphaproteobacteria bacterium]|nr:radical SAM protein [Alphaproteobacteria bacterium]MCB9795845.1 radical SAM protein [Alphaproteobacteria bacterium]
MACSLPPSVNFHLWQPCNMRCRFCFARFTDVRRDVLPKGHLPRDEALRLARLLGQRFDKVTFAGGEATLCPWLPDLVQAAHEAGATTMLVCNGSLLTDALLDALAPWLDWLTLSVDSPNPETLERIGRRGARGAIPLEDYARLANAARARGMRVKLNTVICSENVHERLHSLVRALRPERWKMLRALPIQGQNDGEVEPLLVSDADWQACVARHQDLAAESVAVVPEDNADMTGSYAMIDPAGRFFDNVTGAHRYSAAILEVGLDAAWPEVGFMPERFEERGAVYSWR